MGRVKTFFFSGEYTSWVCHMNGVRTRWATFSKRNPGRKWNLREGERNKHGAIVLSEHVARNVAESEAIAWVGQGVLPEKVRLLKNEPLGPRTTLGVHSHEGRNKFRRR